MGLAQRDSRRLRPSSSEKENFTEVSFFFVGAIAEAVWKVFNKAGEPPITRFVAVELAKDHFFDLTAAKRRLIFRLLTVWRLL